MEAGAEMLYVTIFDEIDEGTAIYKVPNNFPVGASAFVTYEGLPSDFYMRLVCEAGKWIHGKKGYSAELPLMIKYTNIV